MNKLLYTLNENDLKCVDWKHQIFQVSDEFKNKLTNLPSLNKGRLEVRLKVSILYQVDIINESTNYKFGRPKLMFQESGLFFFHENWFFIRYLKNKKELEGSEESYFAELVNEDLFNFLMKKDKLNCENWTYTPRQVIECCELDMDPGGTASKVFNNE